MVSVSYDLHIHSCLSPCADEEMTPANIAGMAAVNGLGFVGLTDHNSCGNCAAFFEACRGYGGLTPVAGMELTTAEEIHVLVFFSRLEEALLFEAEVVAPARSGRVNRGKIFGHQWLMDGGDRRLGEVEELLVMATGLGLEEATAEVRARHGVVVPAHVDREANGILGILGDIPEAPDFPVVEFQRAERVGEFLGRYPRLAGRRVVCSSDAHRLKEMHEAWHWIEVGGCTAGDLVAALGGVGGG